MPGSYSIRLKQMRADQQRLDAFLHDLRHDARNHEGSVLDVQGILDVDILIGDRVPPVRAEDCRKPILQFKFCLELFGSDLGL